MCKCSQISESSKTDFQYAVKIVCGIILKESSGNPLPIGNYKTKVNIHNPSRCECVTFRWKVALGLPHLKVGKISDFSDATLCADEAFEITYDDIEGWVVIETPSELDVVAVYGTSGKTAGPINAFHTERVAPRCLPVCDDFHLDISTGVSAWEVKTPSNATFNIGTLTSPNQAWKTQDGSLWIKPGNIEERGDYVYQLKFNLCSGFRNPLLDMNLLADDYIKGVSLNGHTILSSQGPGSNFNINPIHCSVNQFFKTGENVLTIVVHNAGKRSSPTGLCVHGLIDAENGLCPGKAMPLLCCPTIEYNAYVQKFPLSKTGWWLGWEHDGSTAGTTGQNRRMEKLKIQLTGCIPPGTTLQYDVRSAPLVGGAQWLGPVSEGNEIGNLHWRMEMIKIDLINAPLNCHLLYRVHMRHNGWGPWVTEGSVAGSSGQNRRIEAIEIKFV
jgi:Clostridial hydrophobic W